MQYNSTTLAPEQWGTENEDASSFILRNYLTLPLLSKEDMDFKYFDGLADKYRSLLKKDRIIGLTYRERKEKEGLYNKMLALMLHFFTKTVNPKLKASTAMVDRDDFDSVIAMTLVKCLALREKSIDFIADSLTEEQCASAIKKYRLENNNGVQTSLFQYALMFDKKDIIKEILADFDINEAYLDKNGVPFYNEKDASYVIAYIINLSGIGKPKKIRTSGFSSNGNFGFYVTSAIKKEINKLFRAQLEIHYPAHAYITSEDMNNLAETETYLFDKENQANAKELSTMEKQQSVSVKGCSDPQRITPHRTLAIFSAAESEAAGLSGAAINMVEASVSKAINVSHGHFEKEETEVAESYERRQLNNILCDAIHHMDDGDIVLYRFGIDYDRTNGRFSKTSQRTFKETAEKFNMETYRVKSAVKKCGEEFKRKYPNFFIQYFE